VAKLDNESFAKAIHDLCVAAGVNCGHRACQEAPTVKRTSRTGRRNLTVAEAQRLSRKGR
jgi:hypothetical protein